MEIVADFMSELTKNVLLPSTISVGSADCSSIVYHANPVWYIKLPTC